MLSAVLGVSDATVNRATDWSFRGLHSDGLAMSSFHSGAAKPKHKPFPYILERTKAEKGLASVLLLGYSEPGAGDLLTPLDSGCGCQSFHGGLHLQPVPLCLADVMVPSWLLLCFLSHGSFSRE